MWWCDWREMVLHPINRNWLNFGRLGAEYKGPAIVGLCTMMDLVTLNRFGSKREKQHHSWRTDLGWTWWEHELQLPSSETFEMSNPQTKPWIKLNKQQNFQREPTLWLTSETGDKISKLVTLILCFDCI